MFARLKLICLVAIAGSGFLPSLLMAQSNPQSEESRNANQDTVIVFVVSYRFSPGGPVQSADYGESEDLAKGAAKSLREARGLNGEQLYFDVQLTKKEVPASSSPSTRRTPQGPVDAPNRGSQGGKPGGTNSSGTSDGSTTKSINPTAKDKQWTLWVQKKANGRWKVSGSKEKYDDYASFYAAYQTTKERVDAANKGLPGLLYSVGFEEVSKPKKIEFQDIAIVDVKPVEPYKAPRIGFDDSVPKGQAGKSDAPKSSEAKEVRYYVERRSYNDNVGQWGSWAKERDPETNSGDLLPMKGAIDQRRRLQVKWQEFSQLGPNAVGPYEFRIVDEQGNPVGDVLRVPN